MQATPPLLQLAVALILARMASALASAWLVNEVASRNEVLAFSGVVVAVSFVGATFIWRRKRWAAWLMIVLTGLDVVLNLFAPASSALQVGALVFAELTGIWLIVTLRRREVWSVLA